MADTSSAAVAAGTRSFTDRARSAYVLGTMRLARDHLIYKALVALQEAVESCRAAPIRPNRALRFTLAFLYAHSDGDRRVYDEFWRTVQDPVPSAYSPEMASYQRRSYAQTAWNGIARSVGAPMTTDYMSSITRALRPRERSSDPSRSS